MRKTETGQAIGNKEVQKKSNCKTGRTDRAFLSLASTPPMGWNSYDCFDASVTEEQAKQNADYMAKHLVRYGWNHVVLDIQWFGPPPLTMDEWGRFWPKPERFPSAAGGKGFKPLADYIHAKGLKFGLHLLRGIPRPAVEKNTRIRGSKKRAADIADTVGATMTEDAWGICMDKSGAQKYYDSVFALLAEWNVDFVKVDDLSWPYHQEEIEAIRKAMDRCGRPIVFSTSPGPTSIEKGRHVSAHANMWRISGDFWDNWQQLEDEFELLNQWSGHIRPGNWPDADMLPIGSIAIRAHNPWTKFTRDEQYTLMSLWCIARSPLIMGGHLPGNDEFTLSLLTNEEVIAVNQDSLSNRQIFRRSETVAWTADVPGTNDKYLALFNLHDPWNVNDGRVLFKSDLITRNTPGYAVDIDVDITNARKLYLIVDIGPDDMQFDHANWAEPRLIGRKKETKLTELNWLQATSGWGTVCKNKSITGGDMAIDGVKYPYGIGTHSPSLIEYDLPPGHTRFKVRAGLDECGMKKSPTGATVQFVVCTEKALKPYRGCDVSATFAELGLKGKCHVRDLWRKMDIGTFEGEFTAFIPPHGAGLYRITK